MQLLADIGQISSYIALFFGIFFFLFASKYYFAILIALFGGKSNKTNFYEDEKKHNFRKSQNFEEPFVSIQLPFYNEKNVAERIIDACINLDYKNYEIIVADDSRDETINVLKKLIKRKTLPTIKFVHRKDRSGFKGGALQKAIEFMDPKSDYVVVLDADFIPPKDLIKRFLWYFNDLNRENNKRSRAPDNKNDEIFKKINEWYERKKIGVVQGYQLHYLNKNENWITKGIRAEYSGGYMIERVAQEFFGSMKMITGSVFMIRADILKNLGWTHSITEDWDLTIRMYLEGYKVLYTPLIQAPAEIPTTIRALTKQRMRWAEGHTFTVKKYFWQALKSPNLTLREKLEFLYFAPYYLQSLFFLIGTLFWTIAELLHQHPPFWTEIFGWCLILSNFLSLPLMSITGLYLEQTARDDFIGIFSSIVLSYLLAPFQAYAAFKGLIEKEEGDWIRTLKTGSITDRILQIKLRKLFNWIIPLKDRRKRRFINNRRNVKKSFTFSIILIILLSSFIVYVTGVALSKKEDENINNVLYIGYTQTTRVQIVLPESLLLFILLSQVFFITLKILHYSKNNKNIKEKNIFG